MESSRWAVPAAETHAPPTVTEPSHSYTEDIEPDPYANPMDGFAQTRGADDLFEDDFIPIEQPVVERQASESTPKEAATVVETPVQTNFRGAGRGSRGPRGRGRAGVANNTSQRADSGTANGSDSKSTDTAPTTKPESKPTAVRGDRSNTGGVKKERLTEEQLEERMRNMSLKNAALQAAHERAQQDEAAFAAREAAAAEQRRVDRQNRQQMMGERERNRQRKLQAVGGREWDAEKREEDFAVDERRGARRGAHGAVVGGRSARPAQAQQEVDDAEDGYGAVRRGGYHDRGRARGRGRGGGRGGRFDGHPPPHQQQHQGSAAQALPTPSDFPSLPASTAPKPEAGVKAPTKLEFPHKPRDKPAAPSAAASAGAAQPQPETEEDRKKPEQEQKSSLAKPREASNTKFDFAALSSPGADKRSWADQVESPT